LIPTALLVRSSDGRPIVWCVIGIFAGIYIFFQGFRLLQRKQLILNTPVSKIRSASMGMVELSGLAVGPYTMAAPITGRVCYYYHTLIWEWKRSGRSSKWVKVAAECMHVPFFLDDNTGKMMVDPRGAELDLHCDFKQEFSNSFFTTKEEIPPNVYSFLSRHGVSTPNKIKVEEFCIKPKNALFLLGTLDENSGIELTPQPIHDDETAALGTWNAHFSLGASRLGQNPLSRAIGEGNLFSGLSLTGGLQHDPAFDSTYEKAISTTRVVHLSSDPAPTKAADMTQQQKIAAALLKAGVSSPAAWAAAGVTSSGVAVNGEQGASAQGATSAILPQDQFDPRPPVVMMKGKNNPTFLISWRSQSDLASSLNWKCTLMIWGGPALTLLCLYALQNLTHWF
jgi:hypothetical protein